MSGSKETNALLKKLITLSFGENKRCIVEAGKPSTANTIGVYALVLEDVTGFSCTDTLLEGTGTYATDYSMGFEFPGGLKDISVTTGKILFIYK